jgi:DNA polymerase III epsilon subunit-like protein
MNVLWIDVETTGLGSNAAVIEIAAIPMIDGEIKSHFHSMIRPHDKATLDAKAFEVTKIDINEIWSYPEARDVLNEFIKWIDSHETVFNLGGHNIKFDRDHLFKLFCRNAEYGSFITRFNHNDIDTLRICREVFKGKKNKPVDFKLESVCRYFGTEDGVYHRALGDIQNTIEIYKELEKLKEKQIPVKHDLTYRQKMEKYMDMKYVQMNPEGDVFITKEALVDQDATKFILSFLWDKHIGMIA